MYCYCVPNSGDPGCWTTSYAWNKSSVELRNSSSEIIFWATNPAPFPPPSASHALDGICWHHVPCQMRKEPSGQSGPLFIYFFCEILHQLELLLPWSCNIIFVTCPLPDILISTQSFLTICRQVMSFLGSTFNTVNTVFNVDISCTFHIVCQCANCYSSPHP